MVLVDVSSALTPASAGLPGHKVGSHTAVGAQHTQTLTSLFLLQPR